MVQNCAGILLTRMRSEVMEFFLVSPGGPLWNGRFAWAPPKGHIEDTDCSALAAAIREFREETGVAPVVKSGSTVSCVSFKQNKDKNVTLYIVNYDDFVTPFDPKDCHSNTFQWTDGQYYPEVDKFEWLTAEEADGYCVKAYYPLLVALSNQQTEYTINGSDIIHIRPTLWPREGY